MQFNSHSTEQDIVSMADDLAKSSSVSFPLKKKVLYANQAQRIIMSWIHEAFGGWTFDDANQTDLPEPTRTLTSGQSDYTLPVEASALQGISVKNQSGIWHKLHPITLEEIQDSGVAESEFCTTDGEPRYYRPLGNTFRIYPASNYTQSASIKLHETRDISTFATTDTTKTPGFDSRYHEAVPTFMALQHAKINSLENKKDLQRDWDGDEDATGREGGYKRAIKRDFSRRFAELFPPRITVNDATREAQ